MGFLKTSTGVLPWLPVKVLYQVSRFGYSHIPRDKPTDSLESGPKSTPWTDFNKFPLGATDSLLNLVQTPPVDRFQQQGLLGGSLLTAPSRQGLSSIARSPTGYPLVQPSIDKIWPQSTSSSSGATAPAVVNTSSIALHIRQSTAITWYSPTNAGPGLHTRANYNRYGLDLVRSRSGPASNHDLAVRLNIRRGVQLRRQQRQAYYGLAITSGQLPATERPNPDLLVAGLLLLYKSGSGPNLIDAQPCTPVHSFFAQMASKQPGQRCFQGHAGQPVGQAIQARPTRAIQTQPGRLVRPVQPAAWAFGPSQHQHPHQPGPPARAVKALSGHFNSRGFLARPSSSQPPRGSVGLPARAIISQPGPRSGQQQQASQPRPRPANHRLGQQIFAIPGSVARAFIYHIVYYCLLLVLLVASGSSS
ncbi:hypothetical protein RHGRI_020848 [Rhododendron griersonianum]|uniref:Uncharacterized protein n=1 Tax=Rhododendron griersonianum TaxID=479676 RepID=A0AAV6JL54_9ERIC|nr:hypothetical protein RHGRI_020848 [Rhododendron griersonianum]